MVALGESRQKQCEKHHSGYQLKHWLATNGIGKERLEKRSEESA
jgi:hypothetical protein